MPRFGKANATGRSSGKWTAKDKRIWGPPKGEPWCWLTTELLSSAAWRARSINTARFIDFLLIEHRNHAGMENGKLPATYDQLQDYGLTRSEIRPAIEEAEFLGLAKVMEHGGRWGGSNQPSTYRLTFYASSDRSPATNEWKGKTVKAIEAWKRDKAELNRARKERRKNRTVVPLPELR